MISPTLLDLFGSSLDWENTIRDRREQFENLLTQTFQPERAALYLSTRCYYSGQGSILGLGTAAGGSTYCLASGVLDNPSISNGKVHGFDLFGGYSVEAFKDQLEARDLHFETDLDLFD